MYTKNRFVYAFNFTHLKFIDEYKKWTTLSNIRFLKKKKKKKTFTNPKCGMKP